MDAKSICIFGAGGHGKVVAEIAECAGFDVSAFFDDYPVDTTTTVVPVLSSMYLSNVSIDKPFIIAVGSNAIRKDISKRLRGFSFFRAIHPSAFVSRSASIGDGTVVMVNAIINANARIGQHVIINSAAIVEHDCVIGDFVHISPSATLSGNVQVGKGSHIGAGATIKPGVKIGKWCSIGAGAVIVTDVPDGAVVVGNPGRILRFNDYEIFGEEEAAVAV